MAQRPSEPLLSFLREAIRKKGLSVSELAGRIGRERAEIRRALAGELALSVDDLVLISQALQLTPAELGLAPSGGVDDAPAEEADDHADEDDEPAMPRLRVAPARPAAPTEEPRPSREPRPSTSREDDGAGGPDPSGNLPEQVIRLGFALGIDLFILFDSTLLKDSGVPEDVLGRFKDQLPIKLEAKYHRHNRPLYGVDSFGCILSFDRLYTCTFPWAAFRQVTFHMPTEVVAPAPAPPPPEAPKRPTLRLVK